MYRNAMTTAFAVATISLCRAQNKVGVALEYDSATVFTVNAGEELRFELVACDENLEVFDQWDQSDRGVVLVVDSSFFVFATETGRKIPERTALAKCKAAAAKAGIERAKLHKFRSSFASHLVMAGVLIQDVSRLLGHHSISETESGYAYLAPSQMKPQVNVICQVDIDGKKK